VERSTNTFATEKGKLRALELVEEYASLDGQDLSQFSKRAPSVDERMLMFQLMRQHVFHLENASERFLRAEGAERNAIGQEMRAMEGSLDRVITGLRVASTLAGRVLRNHQVGLDSLNMLVYRMARAEREKGAPLNKDEKREIMEKFRAYEREHARLTEELNQMEKQYQSERMGKEIAEREFAVAKEAIAKLGAFKEIEKDVLGSLDIPVTGIMFKITPEEDAAYLDAVKQGDMETAQRMVDQAAKKAGYNVGPVYHGTPTGEFTVFDKSKLGTKGGHHHGGFSFTTDQGAALGYANGFSDEAVNLDNAIEIVNRVFANTFESNKNADKIIQQYWSNSDSEVEADGPVEIYWGVIDDNNEFADDLMGLVSLMADRFPSEAAEITRASNILAANQSAMPEVKSVYLKVPGGTPVIKSTAELIGTDAVNVDVRNEPTGATIMDLGGEHKVYYVADPANIKSADAVTRDDAGRVIPLSQRFDSTKDDIRYKITPDPMSLEEIQSRVSTGRLTAQEFVAKFAQEALARGYEPEEVKAYLKRVLVERGAKEKPGVKQQQPKQPSDPKKAKVPYNDKDGNPEPKKVAKYAWALSLKEYGDMHGFELEEMSKEHLYGVIDNAVNIANEIMGVEIFDREQLIRLTTGYGEVTENKRTEFDRALSKTRSMLLSLARINDMAYGNRAKKVETERLKTVALMRELAQEVLNMLDRGVATGTLADVDVETVKDVLNSRFDNMRRALKMAIQELAQAIERGTPTTRGEKQEYEDPSDIKELKRIKKELQAAHDAMPAVLERKKALYLQNRVTNLKKQISALDEKIEKAKQGVFETVEKKTRPTTQEINDLTAERDGKKREQRELEANDLG
ncbi:MAG: hypothetical protein PHW63_11950, partial [Alphaproteobacteria bacterium]|nr:hypothetical protein [Alphaproteobacteria bacterium]